MPPRRCGAWWRYGVASPRAPCPAPTSPPWWRWQWRCCWWPRRHGCCCAPAAMHRILAGWPEPSGAAAGGRADAFGEGRRQPLQLPARADRQFEMVQVPAVAGTVGLARRRFAVLDVDPVVAGATAAGQAMEGRQAVAQRGPADQHLEAGFTGEGEPGLAGRAIATGDGQHTGKQYGEQ